jgi:hypothetical protein
MRIPRLAFPKLVALTIRNAQLWVLNDEIMEFPMLDSLTLHEDWSSLLLISAPKLTKLILRCEERPSIETMSVLRRVTVRPTSLIISDMFPDANLPELLTMWCDLVELHLGCHRDVYMLDQISLSTLAGNSPHGILCPHLRYLTVHANQRDPTVRDQIIQTLHTIVEERRQHNTDGLRRVMCVWQYWDASDTRQAPESKEIEWVDIL